MSGRAVLRLVPVRCFAARICVCDVVRLDVD